MKLTDISKQALHEAITNEAEGSGYLAEDLIKIVEAKDGEWSAPMTGAQLMEQMNTWLSQK